MRVNTLDPDYDLNCKQRLADELAKSWENQNFDVHKFSFLDSS